MPDVASAPIAPKLPSNEEHGNVSSRAGRAHKNTKMGHQKLLDEGSKVYRSFIQMEDSAFTDGALKKT